MTWLRAILGRAEGPSEFPVKEIEPRLSSAEEGVDRLTLSQERLAREVAMIQRLRESALNESSKFKIDK